MGISKKQPKTQINPQFMKKQKQRQQHYEKVVDPHLVLKQYLFVKNFIKDDI